MRTLIARTYNILWWPEGTGWLCRIKVNSEQLSFESFAEAGERLRDPDIGRKLVTPLRSRYISYYGASDTYNNVSELNE